MLIYPFLLIKDRLGFPHINNSTFYSDNQAFAEKSVKIHPIGA